MVYTWDMDPELINIFGTLSIRYYSILFGLGIVVSGTIVQKVWLRLVSDVSFDKLATYIVIGIVLGARLGHCLFYDPVYYFQNPVEMLLPIQKIEGAWQFTGYLGLASHGGSIGVLLAIYLFSNRNKISYLRTLDIVAIATPLAGAFIRFGNFMNSEIIGKPSGDSYGIIFKNVDNIPRHPSQLYEAIIYLLIFIILYFNRKKILEKKGRYVGMVVALVFIARFLIEFTKIDQASFEACMILNMGQVLSLPFIIIGIILTIGKK